MFIEWSNDNVIFMVISKDGFIYIGAPNVLVQFSHIQGATVFHSIDIMLELIKNMETQTGKD